MTKTVNIKNISFEVSTDEDFTTGQLMEFIGYQLGYNTMKESNPFYGETFRDFEVSYTDIEIK